MGISVGGDIIDVRERRWVMLSRVLSHILNTNRRAKEWTGTLNIHYYSQNNDALSYHMV